MLDSQLVRVNHDPEIKNQHTKNFTQDDLNYEHGVIVSYVSFWTLSFPIFLENNQNDSTDPTELETAN